MADKDITGRVVERTVALIGKLQVAFKNRVPYGPTQVGMSRREGRRMFQQMDAPTQEAYKQKVGLEEWERLMEKLYARR